jgi:hypothetical protein
VRSLAISPRWRCPDPPDMQFSDLWTSITRHGDWMVPIVGFELTTYRLQGGCSTPELNRRYGNSRTGPVLTSLA